MSATPPAATRRLLRKSPGPFRKTNVETTLDAPAQIAEPGVAILVGYRLGGTAERPLKTFVTLDAAGKLRLTQAYTELNMMTGEGATQITNAGNSPRPIPPTSRKFC